LSSSFSFLYVVMTWSNLEIKIERTDIPFSLFLGKPRF
jgi:hypothetical protein